VFGTDDTTAIRNAIASLDSVFGGAIYFQPRIYLISGKLTVDRPTSFVGFSIPYAPVIPVPIGGTVNPDNYWAGPTLFWMNAVGDKMISVANIKGGGFNGLILHCNETANYGLWADRMQYAQIFNLYVLRPATDGIILTATSGVANENTMFNQFNNISIYNAPGGSSGSCGLRLTSSNPLIQNCCHNRFYSVRVNMVNDDTDYGIYIDAADNNTFLDVFTDTMTATAGKLSKAMYFGTNSGGNYVYHIQAFPGGVESNNNSAIWGPNIIHDYDRLNTQLEPTITSGSLVWDELPAPGVSVPTGAFVNFAGRYHKSSAGAGDFLIDSSSAGVVHKDTAGVYWRVMVNTSGTVTTTSLGSTRPTE